MRFESYLTEATGVSDKEMGRFETNWKRVERECAPVLKDLRKIGSKDKPLFFIRGTYTDAPIEGEIRLVRKMRSPKDTSQMVHKWMDDYFAEKYKFRMRSNGLFVKGNKNIVSSYGSEHIILPIGKYKYYWSEDIEDLFQISGTIMISDKFRQYGRDKFDPESPEYHEWYMESFKVDTSIRAGKLKEDFPEHYELIKGWILEGLNASTYKTTGLKRALQSKNEIVLKCDSYWIFRHRDFIADRIFDK